MTSKERVKSGVEFLILVFCLRHDSLKGENLYNSSLARFPSAPLYKRLAHRNQIRDGNLERGRDSFYRLKCEVMR